MNIVVATIALQVLGIAFILPILGYFLYLVAVEGKRPPLAVRATRVMLLCWGLTLLWFGAWRTYSWWFIGTYEELPPGNEIAALFTSTMYALAALSSLVCFVARVRTGKGAGDAP